MAHSTDSQPTWGAIKIGPDRWRLSVWAPSRERIEVEIDGDTLEMRRDQDGWHGIEMEAPEGTPYALVSEGQRFADPASRVQADALQGPSRLIDPARFRERVAWSGRDWDGAVIFELHLGTFTDEGTLAAAVGELPRLAALGFTAVELMPIAHFAGQRGWGYDGVLPYAPHPTYGSPEDLAAFVAAAHELGLMVMLDVVYNHFGPEGDVLHTLSPSFFTSERVTPWGSAIDFDRPEVRSFFIDNASMWLRDYGFDGLRLDAVHEIGLPEENDFLEELGAALHALDVGRPVHLVTEDERNLASYVGRQGGWYRAQWNDDFHHAVHVTLTGEDQSYYKPFSADPFDDLARALKEGQVDQGQERPFAAEPRGEPSGHLPPQAFVNSIQTHDQIGNRAKGDRLITLADEGHVRVAYALMCLSPFVPMIFMGEEAGSRAPFLFFADFGGDLADAVRKGRRSEFPDFADAEVPDPIDDSTFRASRPYAEAPNRAEWEELTKRLLGLRAEHVVPLLASGWTGTEVDKAADRALRGEWSFEGGRLEICLCLGTTWEWKTDMTTIYADGALGEDAYAIRVGIRR